MRLDAVVQQPLSPVSRDPEARSGLRSAETRADGVFEPSARSERRGLPWRGIDEALAAADLRQRQRQSVEGDNVAPRNRNAIAAYLANVPGPLERLGVELAGIDDRV